MLRHYWNNRGASKVSFSHAKEFLVKYPQFVHTPSKISSALSYAEKKLKKYQFEGVPDYLPVRSTDICLSGWLALILKIQEQEYNNKGIIIIIFINCNWFITRWQRLFACTQIWKKVTRKFKSGGLHERHVVATWKLGNHLSIRL
jgi:hypothetical protein